MAYISLVGPYGVNNAIIPREGPKAIGTVLDFSNAASIIVDGEQVVARGQISFLQGMYVDNAYNDVAITFEFTPTNQRIIVPANTQGYYAILQGNPPRITANMAQQANRKVSIMFYNVPIQQYTWTTA